MKRKIGVLTFHNGPNFGGYLQAWHMVHAVRALGHDCYAVNYLHEAHHEANKIRIPLRSVAALKGRIFWALKNRPFKGIGDTLCDDPFTTNAEDVPWSAFDGFVVGSDIVWDYQEPRFGHDPAYFGMLPGQEGKPMVAYAASCGPASPEGPFPDFVEAGLRRFEHIGVRDPATAELVRHASGRESTLVVDPTWLADDPVPEWRRRPRGNYVFVYGGRVDEKLGVALRDHCRKRGLKLVSALTSCRWADKTYRSLHPFQWVDLFRQASAVVVQGTLHGTVYSLKFGKPFILINSGHTRAKIAGILETTNTVRRAFEPGRVSADELGLLDEPGEKLSDACGGWIRSSRDFLSQALESTDP
jgi:hypothetical protein